MGGMGREREERKQGDGMMLFGMEVMLRGEVKRMELDVPRWC